MPRRVLILALALSGSIPVVSQSPPASGVIAGRVVDGVTGQPIAGAMVRLGRAAAIPGQTAVPPAALPPYYVETNEQGQFVFAKLAPSRYTIFSDLSGYLTGQHGQQRIEGPSRPVSLQDGQRVTDLTIRMWRYGVITGVVRDETGEPVIDVFVRALRRTFVGGRPRFVRRGDGYTDDRGVYRVTRLVPGEYVVAVVSTLTSIPAESMGPMLAAYRSGTSSNEIAAVYGASALASSLRVGSWFLQRPSRNPFPAQPPTENALVVYPATFHPAAMDPGEATVVRVQPADERLGVDLQLRPVQTFRVSGVVTGSDGQPMRAGLRLMPVGTRESDIDGEFAAATTGSDAAGRFTFLGVPPGQYVVTHQRIPEPKSESLGSSPIDYGGGVGVEGVRMVPPAVTTPLSWAEAGVTVTGHHVEGVSVVVRPGSHLRGTMTFAGSGPKPTSAQIQRIAVTLTRTDGLAAQRQSPATQVDETGRFMTSQYVPGRYALSATALPAGWTLRSAAANGRDILEAPLELTGADVPDITLTFGTGRPVISGTVQGPGTGSESTVLVFPADYKSWIATGMLSTRARTVPVGRDGAFDVSGLLPGAYLAIAVDTAAPVQLQDPSSVNNLARGAKPVRLGEDGVTAVSLTVTAVTP